MCVAESVGCHDLTALFEWPRTWQSILVAEARIRWSYCEYEKLVKVLWVWLETCESILFIAGHNSLYWSPKLALGEASVSMKSWLTYTKSKCVTNDFRCHYIGRRSSQLVKLVWVWKVDFRTRNQNAWPTISDAMPFLYWQTWQSVSWDAFILADDFILICCGFG